MSSAGQTSAADKDPAKKTATGEFEVRLSPQDDREYAAGRMTLDKNFHGDLEGLNGSMSIRIEDDNHYYDFEYGY